MHALSIGLALLLALAIIVVGGQYLFVPRTATRSFGLPLPEKGANTDPWLRLKGVRDVAVGLTVLATMAWGTPREVGILLLAEAFIPVGDMLVILRARGSARLAWGMHGTTAAVMVLTAAALLAGGQ